MREKKKEWDSAWETVGETGRQTLDGYRGRPTGRETDQLEDRL